MLLHRTLPILAIVTATLLTASARAQSVTVDFDDLPLGTESYENGLNLSGSFSSQGAIFNNYYDSVFDYWENWAYSNTTNTTTSGFMNQYSAYTSSNSGNYGVATTASFASGQLPTVTIPGGATVDSIDIANTTYAYLSMLNGDGFAKQFGGPSHTDPDYFLLQIEGFLNNVSTGTVDFYLADFRFSDGSLDYIVDDWNRIYLNSLGTIDELVFSLTTTDVGIFGPNTPLYFAMDNLVYNYSAVPEPSSLLLSLVGVAGLWRLRKQGQGNEAATR